MQKLVIQDDDGKQTIVPIVREEITIGREEGNTIRLTERNVSRRHARLVRENGSLFFEDTEARYGSKKNGQRVVGRVEFADRDVFVVGDYRLFLYSEAAVATQAAMPAQTHVPGPPPPVGTDNTAVIPIQPMSPAVASSPGTPARLVVMNTNLAGLECALTGDELVVGRTADNGFAVDHRSISRHHARFTKTESGHRVTDLGSANGTRVNGETYNDIDLRRGDIVELGHVKLRYVGAGESFVFTGAVADDRDSSGGVPKMLVLFAILAVLAAVGVIVMVLFGPSGEEGVGQPGVQGGTSAAAPDAIGAADTAAPAADVGGALVASPDVGTVPPQQQVATADSGATIREAERLMRAAQWDEAIELLRTVQVGDPLFGDANTKLDLARSEQSTRENLYNRLVEAEGGGRFAEALDLLGQIPQTSYYHELLATEGAGARLQEAWIAGALEQAGQQAAAHRYSDARATLATPRERFGDDPRFTEALQSIDTAEEAYETEQAAIAERERLEREEAERLERERQEQLAAAERDTGAATPPENPRERDAGTAATPPEPPRERDAGAAATPPEPEEVDVESLLRDARRLGLRSNHAEAIEVLEQARRADRRNPAIYLMLYSNYIGLGRSGEAADALERYLELRPNDRRADEYRRAIETLRGQ